MPRVLLLAGGAGEAESDEGWTAVVVAASWVRSEFRKNPLAIWSLEGVVWDSGLEKA
jgi:hypothetical protein